MRRGPGLAGINRNKISKQQFASKGTELADAEISHMVGQLESFKTFLEQFASKHQSDIRKNADFRQHFQKLCAQIGVDPLASSKGFWSEILGVGDFYYELGVQIIEVGMATKPKNGGLIPLSVLHQHVLKGRGRTRQDVSEDDIVRAIKKLGVLGNGFKLLPMAGRQIIQSVPSELSLDHTSLLQHCEENSGHTSVSAIAQTLDWDAQRAGHTLDYLVQEGMVWVDAQAGTELEYWVPGFFPDAD